MPQVMRPLSLPPSLLRVRRQMSRKRTDRTSQKSEDAEGETDQPVTTSSAASMKATAQPSMFDTNNEEDEILQEAFYGTQNNHVAA